MRFSTIAFVMAFFAVCAHTYASLFAISSQTSPAAWPTFVDARRVIKTVVTEPIARAPQLVEAIVSPPPIPSASSVKILAAIGQVRDTNGSRELSSSQEARHTSLTLPLKPTGAEKAIAAPPHVPAELPQLHSRLLAEDAAATVQLGTRAATTKTVSQIVTGSIQAIAGDGADVRYVGTARKRTPASPPPFDVSLRSSLGGPVDAWRNMPVIGAQNAQPDDYAKLAAIPAPVRNVRNDAAPINRYISPSAQIEIPTRRPEGLRKLTEPTGVTADHDVPELQPFGRSIAVLRIMPPAMRPRQPQHRETRTAELQLPEPKLRARTVTQQQVPAVHQFSQPDEQALERTRVAVKKALSRKKASARKTSKARSRIARARAVRRATATRKRRKARTTASRRRVRAVRYVRRTYARHDWKMKAFGDSMQ